MHAKDSKTAKLMEQNREPRNRNVLVWDKDDTFISRSDELVNDEK